MPIRAVLVWPILAACGACAVKGNIPDLQGDALCVPGYEEKIPSLCDWARSADAIVVGKVASLAWDRSDPISLATGSDAAPGCHPVTGILQLDLELSTVVTGPVRSGTPLRVIGQDTILWQPAPGYSDEDTTVVLWPPAAAPGIVVGQQLGVVLHRQLGGDQWGTRLEPFFMEEDGRLRFSKLDGLCGMAAPVKTGDFASVSDFARAIDACPAATAAAAARNSAIASDARWRPFCLDRVSVESGVDEDH